MKSQESYLLLTDVVDSTALNEAVGDDEMSAVWQAHDLAARRQMEVRRGREVARSDGFLALFDEMQDAVGFAADYHALLRELPVAVTARVGIHRGLVQLRENSAQERLRGAPIVEIDGIALPLAARVMAAAMGGQTLLTAAAARDIENLPYRFASHGYWQLKGMSQPIELLEVGNDHSPFEPPPDSAKAYRVVQVNKEWVPARKIANNLPAERNDFIGRGKALRRLADLVDAGTRLITLIGMGGVGKTRLALRYARARLGDYPGGVYFCDLTTAREIDGIAHAVAQALDVALAKTAMVEHLGTAIKGRGRCMLILDNFEQVSQYAEKTVGTWIEFAPEATFIVTSREVLSVYGESTVLVPPLDLEEAQELFTVRAKSASQAPSPVSRDQVAIEKLVQMLDGLPLAIELAAARARVMSPSVLLSRMHERFLLLATPGRPPSRQATLRATFDWSWDLLQETERSALAQLTVFEGGFTLEAAEAVVNLDDFEQQLSAVDVVQSLVDKSLVRRVADDRFDILVTVRSYVIERLGRPHSNAGPTSPLAAAVVRHQRYYAHASGSDASQFALREFDNIVAACRHAVTQGDVEAAIGALENAWTAVRVRGPFSLVLELSSAIRASAPLADKQSARLSRISGSALKSMGRGMEAASHFSEGLEHALRAGEVRSECVLRYNLADQQAAAGQMQEAEANLQSAIALARGLGDSELHGAVMNSFGDYHVRLGKLDEASRCFDRALALARVANAKRAEGGVLGNLGMVRTEQGRHGEALGFYQSSHDIARELGDKSWEGSALCNLGMTSQALGQFEEAIAQLTDALKIARDLGQPRLQAFSLCNLGLTLQSLDRLPEASEHFKQAVEIAGVLGDRRLEGQFHVYAATALARLGDTAAALSSVVRAEELLETVSDPVNLGFAIARRAEVEARSGQTAAAKASLRRAEAIAQAANSSGDSEFGNALAEARRIVR